LWFSKLYRVGGNARRDGGPRLDAAAQGRVADQQIARILKAPVLRTKVRQQEIGSGTRR